jgi:hypothetical protein
VAAAKSDSVALATTDASAADPASGADFAVRLDEEAAVVMAEVEEIELLINQAKTEAARHETRRQTANDKLLMAAEKLSAGAGGTPKELADLASQLVSVGR